MSGQLTAAGAAAEAAAAGVDEAVVAEVNESAVCDARADEDAAAEVVAVEEAATCAFLGAASLASAADSDTPSASSATLPE